MSNRLSYLLKTWNDQKEQADWVLGTVFRTEGSAYRKAGAFMLVSSQGGRFGLLSGGCLEADIQRQSRKVMQTGRAATLVYDSTDEDDMTHQLGLGCGGIVHILLQPITAENDLGLVALLDAVQARRMGAYYQRLPDQSLPDQSLPGRNGEVEAYFDKALPVGADPRDARGQVIHKDGADWLVTPIIPDPHLLILGGGADAQPLVAMAKNLGWYVSLCDPRPANARLENFPSIDHIIRETGDAASRFAVEERVDVAVIMNHQKDLDAKALIAMSSVPLKYLALLGPAHRRRDVFEEAGIDPSDLNVPLAGPAGLDIGSDFPEGIALSILAECHAALKGRTGRSLSGVLPA